MGQDRTRRERLERLLPDPQGVDPGKVVTTTRTTVNGQVQYGYDLETPTASGGSPTITGLISSPVAPAATFSGTLTINNPGSGTWTWKTTPALGTVPPGLVLSTPGTTSNASGTVGGSGPYDFFVAARRSDGLAIWSEQLVVVATALTLTGTYPAPTFGVPYSQSLTIAGGVPPYSLTGGTGITAGALPTGMSLSVVGSTLVMSGTATVSGEVYSFTPSVDDSAAASATDPQSGTVAAVSYATWSTTDLAANITLSTGGSFPNTVAQSTTGTGPAFKLGRSSAAITRKSYWETTNNPSGAGAVVADGVIDGAFSLTANSYTGISNEGLMIWQTNGNICFNGGAIGTFIAGRIAYACDPAARKVWIGSITTGVVTWYGGGDPVLGTSPTATLGGTTPLYAAYTAFTDNSLIALQNDPSTHAALSPPTGYASGIY